MKSVQSQIIAGTDYYYREAYQLPGYILGQIYSRAMGPEIHWNGWDNKVWSARPSLQAIRENLIDQ